MSNGTLGSSDRLLSTSLSRRRFLHAGGAAALGLALPGWLGGCASHPIHPAPPWAELKRSLRGGLLLPGDPGFAMRAQPWALQYASRTPEAIATCANEDDVRTALGWAERHEVPLVARSGGHSYAGNSTTTGLMIDVAKINSVEIDPDSGVARLGGGARNRNVYAACRPFSRAVTHGRCKEVGVAGLVLGGGIGFNMRLHGLTCDGLTGTRVVLANGDVAVCNASENADLFWACRGAGGGNFGIHTEFTFQTFPVGDYTIFDITWSDPTVALFDALQALSLSAPETLGLKLSVVARAGAPELVLNILGQNAGDETSVRSLFAPAFAIRKPDSARIETLPYWDAQEILSEQGDPEYSHERSRFAHGALSTDAIRTVFDNLKAWPGTTLAATWKFFLMGGRIAAVSPDATAFLQRDASMITSIELEWTPQDPAEQVARNQAWLDRFHDAMARYTSTYSYVNFIDPAQRDYLHAYYGDHLPRLREVKRRRDPRNVFHYPQSIPV